MFARLKTRRRNRAVLDRLYEAIVERSRAPRLYAEFAIPDEVMGRFEALAIHVFLFLSRCRDEPGLRPLAQDLVDRFVTDVEHSIRELGVGDPSVPKRMRRLAGIFYERVRAYDQPVAARDAEALAAALVRRAVPPGAGGDAAAGLASYMLEEKRRLDAVAAATFLEGRLDDAGREDIDGRQI